MYCIIVLYLKAFLEAKASSEGVQPMVMFENLFFALFGVTGPNDIMQSKEQNSTIAYSDGKKNNKN